MAQFKERETKKVSLISVDGGECDVYRSLTAGEVAKMQAPNANQLLTPLTLIIKDWNLTDDKNNKLKINEEHVAKLDIRDVNAIMDGSGINSLDFLAEAKT